LKKLWVLLFAIFLVNCGGGGSSPVTPTPDPPVTPPANTTPSVKLTTFATGLTGSLDMQIADDNSGRLFVVEQGGRVRIISNGALLPASFLDISSIVSPEGGELGLLGIAFHPDFAHHPQFYVNYTQTLSGGQIQSVIAEFQVTGSDPNVADAGSQRVLLTVNQPFTNHKAGQLAFGNDGFLYFGFGDGGSGGDPNGNGQNTNVYLGKLLRIDVDSSTLPYGIPAGNLFPDGAGGLAEIYAYGFRNPWRFSFDKPTGRLLMADVGQSNWEEIDIVGAPATATGGDFGWNVMEGTHCYPSGDTCDKTDKVLPIYEYDHSNGNVAVIGGYVYHGNALAALTGMYVFGDLSGKIWALKQNTDSTWSKIDLTSGTFQLASFGQDASGELYVVDFGGTISKIVEQ
jgi:glucose/arabinose dehydrogenase